MHGLFTRVGSVSYKITKTVGIKWTNIFIW